MMEAMILLLGQQMSVSAAARNLGESDKRLWRVLEHYVMEVHLAKDWSQVRRLMIDETSARKGHRYVTVVLERRAMTFCSWSKGAVPRPLPSSLPPCLPTEPRPKRSPRWSWT
jgi:transposase